MNINTEKTIEKSTQTDLKFPDDTLALDAMKLELLTCGALPQFVELLNDCSQGLLGETKGKTIETVRNELKVEMVGHLMETNQPLSPTLHDDMDLAGGEVHRAILWSWATERLNNHFKKQYDKKCDAFNIKVGTNLTTLAAFFVLNHNPIELEEVDRELYAILAPQALEIMPMVTGEQRNELPDVKQ